MKKIVPFNKVLQFDNSISEINSISLENNIVDMGDSLSGEFIVSGNYTIADEAKESSDFKFNLPFDVALGVNYNKDNMVYDIDDFRYNIISPDKLSIDIDLYIDGEVLEEKPALERTEEDNNEEELLEEIEEPEVNIDINNSNININDNQNINDIDLFGKIDNVDSYSTYRVYSVLENDTIDTILSKYNITKEELSQYNDISNLKQGDKLIIPSNEK